MATSARGRMEAFAGLAAQIACLGSLLATSTSANAQAAPPAPNLVFEDERPLKLRWARLNAEIVVCNIGDAEAKATAAPVGFSFEADDRAVAIGRVLRVTPASVELAAGECETLQLARGATVPDGGDYTGVIVVRHPTGIVRREVTVSGPARNTTKGAGAVDEVILDASRGGFWDHSVGLEEPASIPLVRPRPRMVVPSAGKTIGVLQNGPHRARVVVDGEPLLEDGVRVLPIRLEAPGEVGTYSGTVDLALGREEAAPVKLRIEASDSVGFAVGALLLGLVLAAGTTFYLQKTHPRWQLRTRRKELTDRYREAKEAFVANYGSTHFKDYRPDEEDIREYQEKVKTASTRYAKDNFLVDRNSDDFKGLVRMLQTAEADAELLRAREGFGGKLTALEKVVDSFRRDYPLSLPLFIERAAGRLRGQALPVTGATEVANEADAYIKLAAEWREMAEFVKRLEAWAEALRDAPLDDRERERLAAAAAKVFEVRMEMVDAIDAVSLEAVEAKRDLRRAYSELAVLGSRHGVWEPPADEAAGRELAITTTSYWDFIPDELGELIKGSKQRPIARAAVEVLERSAKSFADLGILALAVVAAVLVGLPTVITDETFGSWQDYVAALGLGGAAGVATKGLFDTATQLRRHERVEASDSTPTAGSAA